MPVTPSSCALLVTVLMVTACSARQDPGDGIPVDETGRFSFLVEARDVGRITGLLDATLDTIVARSESAPCRIMPDQDRAYLTYDCAAPGTSGVRLMLNRRHPVRT